MLGTSVPPGFASHSILQERCHVMGQRARSIRDYSTDKPAYPNKKHPPSPKPYFPFQQNPSSLPRLAQAHSHGCRYLPSLVLVEPGWPEPQHRLQSVGAELRAAYETCGLRQLASKNRTATVPPGCPSFPPPPTIHTSQGGYVLQCIPQGTQAWRPVCVHREHTQSLSTPLGVDRE